MIMIAALPLAFIQHFWNLPRFHVIDFVIGEFRGGSVAEKLKGRKSKVGLDVYVES